MATLTPSFTLTSTDVSENASLSLTINDSLNVTDPAIGVSSVACTTTGNETIIFPDLDSTRWVYIKNTGVDAAGDTTAATVKVEIANTTRIMDLGDNEFCFFPYKAENSGLLQLEASAGTVVAEYAYWTKG